MIAQDFIDELLSRSDIAEVVGRHVELKKSGANLMGLCPFHAEKSASFSVSPTKNFYHCFGCGASGDALRFLTEHLGLSFVEAVQDLAGRVGLTVPQEHISPADREQRATLKQRRLSMTQALERAAQYYRGQLRDSERAVGYLKGRGLTGEVAAQFGLGFAPPGWRNLAGVFGSYDEPVLEEAGLVRSKEAEGSGPASAANQADESDKPDKAAPAAQGERSRYDWFRNRVIFPIRSVSGELIGFGGRVLDDSRPKYLNSPETPVFSKGRELYGLFEARQALRERGYALVVEGYMDVVALAQHGFANAVATLGTACTADHVNKLFRFTDSVVFSFDGDAAGRRAAGRALEAALPFATDLRSVRFLFLPPEHDPDSFVRELGAKAFEAAVNEAVPLSRQLIEQAAGDADRQTAEGRARLLAQARPLWHALPEGVLGQQVLVELAHVGHMSVPELQRLWSLAAGQGGNGRKPVRAQSPGTTSSSGPLAQSPPGFHHANALLRPRAGRRAPAALADQAVRLLLQHSSWWDRLNADDHQMLHELGGSHGQAMAWLERQWVEHGPMTWSAVAAAMAQEPWAQEAMEWVFAAASAAAIEDQPQSDLTAVLHRLWIERLERLASQLSAEAGSELTDTLKQQIRSVREQILQRKQALQAK